MLTLTNLQKVILHAIVTKPQTGYDVVHTFMAANPLVWRASHQQVYRELNRLEVAGVLRVEKVLQQGKPNKKIYHATDSGTQAHSLLLSGTSPNTYVALCNEATIHSLFEDKEYFTKLLDSHNEQIEGIYIAKCQQGVSAKDMILLDRQILVLHAECTYAQTMIKHLSEQEDTPVTIEQ